MLAASSAINAGTAAEEYAKVLEQAFLKQIPLHVESGSDIVAVGRTGSTLTLRYDFDTFAPPEAEVQDALFKELCVKGGGFTQLAELGGRSVHILQYKNTAHFVTITGKNCHFPDEPVTRADLQEFLAKINFPVTNPNGTVVREGKLGTGLEMVLLVDEGLTKEQALAFRANPEGERRLDRERAHACELVALRRYLKGGAALVYRHEAGGVHLADVRVDRKACGI